jgi:hypothetical protein
MYRVCGKKNCRCVDAQFRHRCLCLCLCLDGKRRTVYIPAAWEATVRQWVARYSEVQDLLEKLSLSHLKRLQNRER